MVFAVLGNSSQQYVSTDFLLKFFRGYLPGFYGSVPGSIYYVVIGVFLAALVGLLRMSFWQHLPSYYGSVSCGIYCVL